MEHEHRFLLVLTLLSKLPHAIEGSTQSCHLQPAQQCLTYCLVKLDSSGSKVISDFYTGSTLSVNSPNGVEHQLRHLRYISKTCLLFSKPHMFYTCVQNSDLSLHLMTTEVSNFLIQAPALIDNV